MSFSNSSCIGFLTRAFILGVCCLCMPLTAFAQQRSPYIPVPDEFASAFVVNLSTGKTLYTFKPNLPWAAASLTKLANALVVVHHAPKWNRIVSLRSVDEVGGGRLRVNDGARLSIRDLFYSSIVGSANNAANALARTSPLGQKKFIAAMNLEARASGATHSSFVDPAGMSPQNIITAHDMARIALRAFHDPLIRAAASAPGYSFTVRNTGQFHKIKSTDLLVHANDVQAVAAKTGLLDEAKDNVVIWMRPLDAQGNVVYGKDMLIVVLGAPTKQGSFASAKRLADWAWGT